MQLQSASLSLIASGLLACACVTGAGAERLQPRAPAKPRVGGTVVFGADQEPRHLNDFVEGGDHLWAAAAHSPTMSGAYTVTPRFTYRNDLVSSVRFRRTGDTMVIRYVIDKRARWSDGVRITAADFRFTWRTIVSRRYRDVILSTVGYDEIRSVTDGPGKSVTVRFKSVFAGWRDLFGEILPAHALRGLDFAGVWKSAIDNPRTRKPIASGPFVLTRWTKGCCMVFDRNRRYWKRRPYLDRIVFRFVEDTNAQVQQIKGGELDVLNPQPQLTFAALRGVESLRIQTSRGPSWEKLDFNLGFGNGPYNPLLKKRFVRVAIAHAIDRTSIVRFLLRPLAPGLPVLNSAIIMSTSPYYKPHWARYRFSAATARAIMTRHGCRRGGDGIFTCQGQRASFRWTGTTGGQRRELTFEIAQNQLRAAGIEIRADFSPPAIVYGRRLPQGDYEIADYAWSSSSPDISGWDNIYGCRSERTGVGLSNRQGYCNAKVTRWLRAGNRELNLRKQAALVNKALAQMAADMAILPLHQLPSMLIHRRSVRGIKDNPLSIGPFWNVASWWRARG